MSCPFQAHYGGDEPTQSFLFTEAQTQGGPGSVPLRFVPRTARTVPAFGSDSTFWKGFLCVSPLLNGGAWFQFRFGSDGSSSTFGSWKDGSDGSGSAFGYWTARTVPVSGSTSQPFPNPCPNPSAAPLQPPFPTNLESKLQKPRLKQNR